MDRMQLVLDDQGALSEVTPEEKPEEKPAGGLVDRTTKVDGRQIREAGLSEATAPRQNRERRGRGTSTGAFRARQYGDRSKADAANRALGKAGELLVVDHEKDFFLSANELRFSEAQPKAFYLYRVFNYHPEVNGGQFYVINGPLSELFELRATNYRVSNLIGDVSVTDFGG